MHFFSANCSMQKWFCLLSYRRQAIAKFSPMSILSIIPSVWIGLNQISTVQIFIRNHSSVEFSPVLRGSTWSLVPFILPLTYLLGLQLIFKSNNKQIKFGLSFSTTTESQPFQTLIQLWFLFLRALPCRSTMT